ncbi:MAG: hypothetical protein H7A41_00625 [Chlamydiales bacterium]|nr:hypothetical protein [Chlamydiales bacterium]
MAAFLRAIPGNIAGAGRSVINTFTLAGEQISNTPLWQRTGGVAVPHFRTAASYWPEPLRFKVFSKETAAGTFVIAPLLGAMINKARGG